MSLTNRYAAYLSGIFDQPIVDRFQRRPVRRALVACMIVNLAALSALPVIIGAAWVAAPFFLAFFPLASAINMSVRGLTEIPRAALDERQAALSDKAFRNAYFLMAPIAAAAGAALVAFRGADFELVGLGAAAAGAIFGLPAMTLAWSLPDERVDDDKS